MDKGHKENYNSCMEVTWDNLGVTGGVDVKLRDKLNTVRTATADTAEDPNSYARRRDRRKAQYKVVEKDISKYHSIINAELRPHVGETIVLGHHQEGFDSIKTLNTELPERQSTDTEAKLRNIVLKLRKGRREAAERLFPKADGHQEVNVLHIERELRKLMTSELREAKRLKSIKSKGHRKGKRKADQREQAKLMERLLQEDPTAAEKLRAEWELKRAEARMMLGTKARRQWAKMAKRFGGKDMERAINAAHMDAESFKQYLNTMSGKAAADQSDESTSGEEDDEPGAAESEKGIWNMPFMKRAREIREIQEKTGIDGRDDYEKGQNDLPDESSRAREFLSRKRDGSVTDGQTIIEHHPEIATKSTPPEFAIADEKSTKSKPVDAAMDLDLMSFVMKPKKPASMLTPLTPEEEDDTPSFNAKFLNSKRQRITSKEIIEPATVDLSQAELVRLAFQPDGDEAEKKFQAKLESEEFQIIEETQSNQKPKVLEGWGNWCAEGYIDERVKLEREEAEACLQKAKTDKLRELKKRGLVKIHPSACKPADKYIISELPKSFRSVEHFNAALRRPVGDQFVTSLASQIASAPKLDVIKGRVISALKAEIPM